MAMVAAMARAPDEDAVLRGGGAEQGEKPLQQRVRLVSVVREQAMIASGDRQSIGCQQQCECQPVTPAVAMREAVPWHYADGDEKGAEQNAGRQPENFWSTGFFGHRFTHATVYLNKAMVDEFLASPQCGIYTVGYFRARGVSASSC